MGSFSYTTSTFTGPLELLLDLIESRKMHISDVSLSQVAEKFVAYIESQTELPIPDTANFIYVASILLLIKSKSLLPGLQLTNEEESSICELEQRLAIFKLLKDQGPTIQELFGASVIYPAEESREYVAVFAPPKSLTNQPGEKSGVELLHVAALDVLARAPKEEKLFEHAVKKVMSLEQMIENLHERISSSLKMNFKQFSNLERGGRVEVIVSFLAMLELVKRGLISVEQQAHFADIQMESSNVGVPSYNSH